MLVYTPPGYGDPANARRRYPVLYLLHGAPDDGMGWVRYGRAPQIVDRLIVRREIAPVLLVFPDGRGDGRFGDSEYLDAPEHRRDGSPGLRIASYIDELPAAIDARYRTIALPGARLLGGVSTGGYGALNVGLQRPQLWGTLFSLSGYYTAEPGGWARPVWGYHPDPARLRAESPGVYVQAPEARWASTRVYLGDGLNERSHGSGETEAFIARLNQAGIPVAFRSLLGKHSWDLWRSLFADALRTLLPAKNPPSGGKRATAAPTA